jgi:hypothetical protein
VAAGIHSRRRAADNLGVEDPELEFRRWIEERELAGGGSRRAYEKQMVIDNEHMDTGEPIFLVALVAMGLCFAIFNESAARTSIEIHRRFGYRGTLMQSRWIYRLGGVVLAIIGACRLLFLAFS